MCFWERVCVFFLGREEVWEERGCFFFGRERRVVWERGGRVFGEEREEVCFFLGGGGVCFVVCVCVFFFLERRRVCVCVCVFWEVWLIARICVRFVSKVVVGNIFMWNRWKKKMEKENGNGGF